MSSRSTAPDATELIDLIAETLDVPGSELDEDSGLGTHAAWTSLRHVQLILAIEESYGVSLSHQEIRGMASVHSIRKVLHAKGVLGS
jgi:acyl carrier protein